MGILGYCSVNVIHIETPVLCFRKENLLEKPNRNKKIELSQNVSGTKNIVSVYISRCSLYSANKDFICSFIYSTVFVLDVYFSALLSQYKKSFIFPNISFPRKNVMFQKNICTPEKKATYYITDRSGGKKKKRRRICDRQSL